MARDQAFLWATALLFIASAAVTVYWCLSMSGGMTMPGGWTMSMAWMRMPNQSWPGAAGGFMGMWIVMMVAMMLPSVVPMLAIYRRSLRGWGQKRLGGRTVLAGAGYFFVWAGFGMAVYPAGVALAAAEMQWPAVARWAPLASGVVLLLAGCLQFTAWKARLLGRCRDVPPNEQPPALDARSAWRHGLRLGTDCSLCCAGFMTILLVTGVMNLGVMTIITIAITVERLAPRPQLAARAAGFVILAVGGLAIGQAIGVV